MTRYLVAAITHQVEKSLLDEGSREGFLAHVTPVLNERTLILMEGAWEKSLLRPGHPSYELCRREFDGLLGDVEPTFGLADSRFNTERKLQGTDMNRVWLKCVSNAITQLQYQMQAQSEQVGPLLANVQSLLAAVQGEVFFPFTDTITPEVVTAARWSATANPRFDRSYIDVARRKGRMFDLVVIVCGGAHAVSITKATGWPLLVRNSPEDLEHLYRAYLACYVWPKEVLDAVRAPR